MLNVRNNAEVREFRRPGETWFGQDYTVRLDVEAKHGDAHFAFDQASGSLVTHVPDDSGRYHGQPLLQCPLLLQPHRT